MSRFIQLHLLTSYPASNLNRDDLGRPKTVIMGNVQRLRVSSQGLKRCWRTSEIFQKALAGRIGIRSKEVGKYVYSALVSGKPLSTVIAPPDLSAIAGITPDQVNKKAHAISQAVAGVFGQVKALPKKEADIAKDPLIDLEIAQLAHISPAEISAINALTEKCRPGLSMPSAVDLNLLRKENQAADIAMFGRMLAASKEFNVDAAVQVSHAMTVHKVLVEDDFFTAVDDLNVDDSGAGHMGVAEFGAGLFYLYVCIDREVLRENLGGDQTLTTKALGALCEAACTVSPTGKQNSYASRAHASYCLAEKGDEQPRQLSVAFLDPVNTSVNMLQKAIERLEDMKKNMDAVYGSTVEQTSFNTVTGKGSLEDVRSFITR